MATAAPEAAHSNDASSSSVVAGALRLLLLGATLGSFMDGFHTYGGATSYPKPVALRMAWWTPALFAIAYALLGFTYRANETEPTKQTRAQAILGATIFTALYFSSGFLPAPNVAKVAVLLVGAGVLFAFFDRSRAAIVTGVLAAFIGPSFEVLLVHLGLFSHLQPDFFGIPIWLPALYFASGPGLGGLMSRVLGEGAPRFLRSARLGRAN
jgi:cytochrome bd-type quinol oxidase subunit 2